MSTFFLIFLDPYFWWREISRLYVLGRLSIEFETDPEVSVSLINRIVLEILDTSESFLASSFWEPERMETLWLGVKFTFKLLLFLTRGLLTDFFIIPRLILKYSPFFVFFLPPWGLFIPPRPEERRFFRISFLSKVFEAIVEICFDFSWRLELLFLFLMLFALAFLETIGWIFTWLRARNLVRRN